MTVTARVFTGSVADELSGLEPIMSRLGTALTEPGTLVWIDLIGPWTDDLHPLGDLLGLHELAVEDVSKHGQRAKVDRYETHALLVAYARAARGDLCEVDVFIGPNWLLTIRERNAEGEVFDIAPVRVRHDRLRAVEPGVGFLLYSVLDAIVDDYFLVADAVEDRLEQIEEDLFDNGPPLDSGLQQDLLTLRRRIIYFRRRAVPLRDVVLSILRREIPWVEDSALIYLEDVLDHLLRVIDQIDTQRELLGNVVEANLALASNRMNEVMKRMTSWGAILIVATLIAGIYGMNFDDMPELRWRYGYAMALGAMLVSTVVLYVWFRRKRWL